tara:strand:+ start:1099 stop:1272 length:174 start_codon:yes stop_codon:yes gene_type:complete
MAGGGARAEAEGSDCCAIALANPGDKRGGSSEACRSESRTSIVGKIIGAGDAILFHR